MPAIKKKNFCIEFSCVNYVYKIKEDFNRYIHIEDSSEKTICINIEISDKYNDNTWTLTKQITRKQFAVILEIIKKNKDKIIFPKRVFKNMPICLIFKITNQEIVNFCCNICWSNERNDQISRDTALWHKIVEMECVITKINNTLCEKKTNTPDIYSAGIIVILLGVLLFKVIIL